MKDIKKKMKEISCQECGKRVSVGFNKPHSLHRTKRKIYPNIQKTGDAYLCTRCIRTKSKKGSL